MTTMRLGSQWKSIQSNMSKSNGLPNKLTANVQNEKNEKEQMVIEQSNKTTTVVQDVLREDNNRKKRVTFKEPVLERKSETTFKSVFLTVTNLLQGKVDSENAKLLMSPYVENGMLSDSEVEEILEQANLQRIIVDGDTECQTVDLPQMEKEVAMCQSVKKIVNLDQIGLDELENLNTGITFPMFTRALDTGVTFTARTIFHVSNYINKKGRKNSSFKKEMINIGELFSQYFNKVVGEFRIGQQTRVFVHSGEFQFPEDPVYSFGHFGGYFGDACPIHISTAYSNSNTFVLMDPIFYSLIQFVEGERWGEGMDLRNEADMYDFTDVLKYFEGFELTFGEYLGRLEYSVRQYFQRYVVASPVKIGTSGIGNGVLWAIGNHIGQGGHLFDSFTDGDVLKITHPLCVGRGYSIMPVAKLVQYPSGMVVDSFGAPERFGCDGKVLHSGVDVSVLCAASGDVVEPFVDGFLPVGLLCDIRDQLLKRRFPEVKVAEIVCMLDKINLPKLDINDDEVGAFSYKLVTPGAGRVEWFLRLYGRFRVGGERLDMVQFTLSPSVLLLVAAKGKLSDCNIVIGGRLLEGIMYPVFFGSFKEFIFHGLVEDMTDARSPILFDKIEGSVFHSILEGYLDGSLVDLDFKSMINWFFLCDTRYFVFNDKRILNSEVDSIKWEIASSRMYISNIERNNGRYDIKIKTYDNTKTSDQIRPLWCKICQDKKQFSFECEGCISNVNTEIKQSNVRFNSWLERFSREEECTFVGIKVRKGGEFECFKCGEYYYKSGDASLCRIYDEFIRSDAQRTNPTPITYLRAVQEFTPIRMFSVVLGEIEHNTITYYTSEVINIVSPIELSVIETKMLTVTLPNGDVWTFDVFTRIVLCNDIPVLKIKPTRQSKRLTLSKIIQEFTTIIEDTQLLHFHRIMLYAKIVEKIENMGVFNECKFIEIAEMLSIMS